MTATRGLGDAVVQAAGSHRAAVIGSPVAHSLSPVLHRAAYRSLGLEDWGYERIELSSQELPGLLDRLTAPVGPDRTIWEGLSVTMPHKQALLSLLDVVDPLATTVGAVNTVVAQRTGEGRALLVGFNTDVAGIVGALRAVAPQGLGATDPGRQPREPLSAVVLGSGATACSTLAALVEIGAGRITVAARRHGGPGRARGAAERMGLALEELEWHPGRVETDAAVAEAMAAAQLVVSTVPAGVADALAPHLAGLESPRGDRSGQPAGVLLDVVYHPWPTALARSWSAAGGRVAPGWLMLLHQAVPQVRLMTGRTPEVEPMRRALESALAVR